MPFENVTGKIIKDNIAALTPLYDMPTTMAEVVVWSNAIREKRKIKRQKNNHKNEFAIFYGPSQ